MTSSFAVPAVAFFLFSAMGASSADISNRPEALVSPGGAVAVKLDWQDGALGYAVSFGGQPLLGWARLGLTVDGTDLGRGAVLAGPAELSAGNETFLCRGVSSSVNACYRQAVFPLRTASRGALFRLEVRAYDEGMAWRWVVPGDGVREIGGEPSGFRLPADSEVWSTLPEASYEGEYRKATVAELQPNQQMMPPVVFRCGNGTAYGAVTEACLSNYCGMRLRHIGQGVLSPEFHDAKKFRIAGEIRTPWRVVMLGRDLNALVNNPILPSLSPKPDPDLAAAPWIRPSRLGWSWMAGGGAAGVNLENMKRYVQACADLGFEGNLVDEGWNHWGGSDAKAWEMVRELVAYGNARGVKTWLWKSCPDRRGIPGLYDAKNREEFFRRCEELGVAGVKLDFLNSEAPAQVDFMENTLKEAAHHHLMVIFHGCNKPTGMEYTWPHEMSREGIRGQEYGVDASLDQRHPFGRLLSGHADYSPFWCNPTDRVRSAGTRAHNLATLITYSSAVMLPCEHPEKIRDMPEAEFFKSVPLVWDETRVLGMSEFGRCAVFARRRGGSWFVGISNDKDPASSRLPLTFLGPGAWLAEIHADTPADRNRSDLVAKRVTAADVLDLSMLSYGGWCARFDKISISRFGGRFSPGERIQVSTADPAAVVRYTLDGTVPGPASRPCPADGIPLETSCRLRVKIISGDGAGAELACPFNAIPEKKP